MPVATLLDLALLFAVGTVLLFAIQVLLVVAVADKLSAGRTVRDARRESVPTAGRYASLGA